ncbi:MAG: amidohydrolase family protein [Phycisphaerae bacterium]|nr:amidohydrolase family protein [Phycisphaerae bacterium]
MLSRSMRCLTIVALFASCTPLYSRSGLERRTPTYARIKACLDAVPAIDTHDHLVPFERLVTRAGGGGGMNLYQLWHSSYYPWFNPLTERKPDQPCETWWAVAKSDFVNARATSFYRYQLPAIQDLYGIDFDRITDAQACELDRRITENYRDPRWLHEVITERANIELMLVDPFWAHLDHRPDYPFAALVLNVDPLVRGFHPSEFPNPHDDPYKFAREQGLRVESLDDYLMLIDRLIAAAKSRGAVALKQVLAYVRTLEFRRVARQRAAQVFGRPRGELKPEEVRDFEDFLMWHLVELAAKHELPIQIHTGHARIQGSSPMLLVDLIEANPKTKFILFHGGFPWVDETGVIVMRHGSHVWLDSVWLPTLSYSMAKRAFHVWLEVMPSDRILWGSDCLHPEGVYGATEFTRRCLAEVLAEKVDRGDLNEEHALRIGRQILRDNALALFPQLKDRLWKHKGRLPLSMSSTSQAASAP